MQSLVAQFDKVSASHGMFSCRPAVNDQASGMIVVQYSTLALW
jgi:hypothetical protein